MIVIDRVDSLLDRITMYRVVLYYLTALVGIAAVYGWFGMLPFDGAAVVLSALFLVFISEWFNDVFSRAFKAPVNVESAAITALILALIVPPVSRVSDFVVLTGVAFLAVASKYLLAWKKKHIFNPVALAVFLSPALLGRPATWWVGTPVMTVPVIIGGLLVVRKIRRGSMAISFAGTVFLVATMLAFLKGSPVLPLYIRLVARSSLPFLMFAMLTEPLTSPHREDLRIVYGAIVGFLFVPDIHVFSWYTTPEAALLLGNIFAYAVSPKDKLILSLGRKVRLSQDTYDFVFAVPAGFRFRPGEYMEWTLPHARPDSRGNRRYFTLASAPEEKEIRLGVKFYTPASSYKSALLALEPGMPVVASQRAGDFVLPEDSRTKVALIAGGIGVTPYRSMLVHALEAGEKRDIVLFYAAKRQEDIVYRDVFDRAERETGLRVFYTLTDKTAIPNTWQGHAGRVDADMITQSVPDYRERIFYLSGPYAMVRSFETVLRNMGIPSGQIRKDFFPGFA